mmetsp:Transcript_2491/g.5929  ORF Transcript_2491/g.5929 Transcript_2491/m.5929 type:complete len:118 (+) Transcript_2491:1050-1403(+)
MASLLQGLVMWTTARAKAKEKPKGKGRCRCHLMKIPSLTRSGDGEAKDTQRRFRTLWLEHESLVLRHPKAARSRFFGMIAHRMHLAVFSVPWTQSMPILYSFAPKCTIASRPVSRPA